MFKIDYHLRKRAFSGLDDECGDTGIGNISMKRFGSRVERISPKDGILGYRISTPRENRVTLCPGDIFVMNSDGIREYFNIYDYPTLLMGTAGDITAAIMDNLGKKRMMHPVSALYPGGYVHHTAIRRNGTRADHLP